ncbi:MAG: type II toxin-antitoxin system YafQ family toxin [Neisseriaceae bacterium]|nr:type II toxin-antitoxin system YafQ family toxin [Neisseriaceae bacterium]MBR5675644.1 type II toxin-antitoxin system YafQ family toxin [Neisseriaceae bacterium]
MRALKTTHKFKRDLKKISQSVYGDFIRSDEFKFIINQLLNDKPLEKKYEDHPLSGRLAKYRDCHLKPDLVLLYQKTKDNQLILVRIGSHSELSL